MDFLLLLGLLASAIAVRWIVAQYPYSGKLITISMSIILVFKVIINRQCSEISKHNVIGWN